MNNISRSKWQVRVAAIIIFLLGMAAGALAINAYRAWFGHGRAAARQDRFEQMLDRLELSAEQRTQVQQILGDTREQLGALRRESEPRVSEIRRQADERMQRTLTPEQWQRFQQMRDEMRGTRRRGRGGRDDRSTPSAVEP